MKHLKKIDRFLLEVIKVPIKVGDTVLGGRFKNKKIVVKKIGKNAKGDITINGKPLLKFRIIKEFFAEPNQFGPDDETASEKMISRLYSGGLRDSIDDILEGLRDIGLETMIAYNKRENEIGVDISKYDESGHHISEAIGWEDVKDIVMHLIDYMDDQGFKYRIFWGSIHLDSVSDIQDPSKLKVKRNVEYRLDKPSNIKEFDLSRVGGLVIYFSEK